MKIPAWLDGAAEVQLPPRTPRTPKDARAFARQSVATLKGMGLSEWQAHELTAIAALETAWGSSEPRQLHNLGGTKPRKPRVEAYRALTGKPQRWCRKAGHVEQADAPVVIYLAYDSDEQFWRLWLPEFVGAGLYVQPTRPEYRDAGTHAWWFHGESWFPALLQGGYRGVVTKAAPQKSIAGHRSIVERVAKFCR